MDFLIAVLEVVGFFDSKICLLLSNKEVLRIPFLVVAGTIANKVGGGTRIWAHRELQRMNM